MTHARLAHRWPAILLALALLLPWRQVAVAQERTGTADLRGSVTAKRSGLVANLADVAFEKQFGPGSAEAVFVGYDDGHAEYAPVGTFAANRLGLHDLTGSVSEWTADWFGWDADASSPAADPGGPASSTWGRVHRGSGWHDWRSVSRLSKRDYREPGARYDDLGFRCALAADPRSGR